MRTSKKVVFFVGVVDPAPDALEGERVEGGGWGETKAFGRSTFILQIRRSYAIARDISNKGLRGSLQSVMMAHKGDGLPVVAIRGAGGVGAMAYAKFGVRVERY